MDLLTETDKTRYRLQRRLIGPVFSQSNLGKYEAPIDAVLDRLVAKLRSLGGEREVDLAEWMHILAYECLSSVTMSYHPGQIEAGSDEGLLGTGYAVWRMWSVLGLFKPLVVLYGTVRWMKPLLPVLMGVAPRAEEGFKPHWPVSCPTSPFSSASLPFMLSPSPAAPPPPNSLPLLLGLKGDRRDARNHCKP